jgi:hypothetical protein
MLKVTVRHITDGRAETFYGDETRVRQRLHREFPESAPYHDLDDVVQAINEYGQAEVEAAPYQPPADQNVLPEGYQTADEGDDPWPREG